MIARKLKSTKIAVPVGMSLVVSGLLLNLVSLLLARSTHPLFGTRGDIGDFVHGLIIGVGISLEIGGIVFMVPALRAARGQRKQESRR